MVYLPIEVPLPDLSWIWEWLDSIAGVIENVYQALWSIIEPIVNTGQGILAGLISFGSYLWDAFIKGMDAVGKWLWNAFNWIYEGLKYWSDIFGQWFNMAMGWIGSGITWVANQLYNFGYWLYNSFLYVWNWIVNLVSAVWNNIIAWFSGVSTAIGSWWSSVIAGINTWFTNLLKVWRQKIITTVMADITIAGAWKGAERILAPQKLSDIGYGLVGVIASPIVGSLVGSIIDAVVPLPSSATYPLIPDITGFAYTPPSVEVPTPTEPTKPEIGVPPTPPGLGYGLPLDKDLLIPSYLYDTTIMTTDKSMTVEVGYDTTVVSTDAELDIELGYETEVT